MSSLSDGFAPSSLSHDAPGAHDAQAEAVRTIAVRLSTLAERAAAEARDHALGGGSEFPFIVGYLTQGIAHISVDLARVAEDLR